MNMELLNQTFLIEVGRSDLIGEYVGQTAPKVKRLFDNAKRRYFIY